jgi:hypothetical protein
VKFPKGTAPEFKRWYACYQTSLRRGGPSDRQIPKYYTSAQDFLRQVDALNHYKPLSYDWTPSPVTYETAPALRAVRDTVTTTLDPL